MYEEYITRNAGLDESQSGFKSVKRRRDLMNPYMRYMGITSTEIYWFFCTENTRVFSHMKRVNYLKQVVKYSILSSNLIEMPLHYILRC